MKPVTAAQIRNLRSLAAAKGILGRDLTEFLEECEVGTTVLEDMLQFEMERVLRKLATL